MKEENEVAEILVKFPSLILEFECACGIRPPPSWSWGSKRKRSAIAVDPKPKPQASSPATPLSFSPSESDENPATLSFRRNVSIKKKIEHCLKIIQDLTKDNDLLYGEIKNVKCYFDKLKEYNLKLKARIEELSEGGPVEKQARVQFEYPGVAHDPPLISKEIRMKDGVGVGIALDETTSLPLGVAASLSSNDDVGPIGIPDLNLPLDEPMTTEFCEGLPLDLDMNGNANKNLSRFMAAKARQNRLHIYRFKNPIGISKSRHSCRS